ncbi:hypothetical protein [Kineococcus rhizosphaerae]|uniref:Uncharacterized protein n=1 Tax=Kineococcus rhizosphaerae TaxID=559628 RepID=A0A2T0QXI6_9ACTN|nr:hypothetical protein [Kineococcus rhizosphaerae]PRY10527.1 hypothetical protein CLV37_11680 [Kineococcus rhizosphaerae]
MVDTTPTGAGFSRLHRGTPLDEGFAWRDVLPPVVPWHRRTRGGLELPAVGLRLQGPPACGSPGAGFGAAELAEVLRGPFTLLDVSDLRPEEVDEVVAPAIGLLGPDADAVTVAATVRGAPDVEAPGWTRELVALASLLGRRTVDVVLVDLGDVPASPHAVDALRRWKQQTSAAGVSVIAGAARTTGAWRQHLPFDTVVLGAETTLTGEPGDDPPLPAGTDVLRRLERGPLDAGSSDPSVRRRESVCREFGTDLPTAVLHHHLHEFRTTSCLVDVRDEDDVRAVLRAAGSWLSQSLFDRLADADHPS